MKQLKKFQTLIYSESETKEILIFFFPVERDRIESMVVDDKVREFAQGLLVEAVDASYKIGFIEATWRSTINPRKPIAKVLNELAKGALSHAFDHATTNDLRKIKIYQLVMSAINRNFRSQLAMFLDGIACNNEKPLLIPTYKIASGKQRLWA
ncbi:hypothetical protein [Vibrio tapetis]|uniref:Uncharacterized protein n=1 Tax=Vibrio tapetis subsp. tapetis TaxID=1671868 RepID=A0A2N8Z9E7_9VIBR|nr:hypothetical protein [Vibrio tapetis]SON48541.1 conserved protein of unknown function [Vibrio tapetis subsp. tapetis]